MDTRRVVEAMVKAINIQHVDQLDRLMSPKVVFGGPRGRKITGRADVLNAFRDYFERFPDYWIDGNEWVVKDQKAMLHGRSSATLHRDGRRIGGRWEVPTAWLAEIEGGQLTRWQVFADTTALRNLLGSEELPWVTEVGDG